MPISKGRTTEDLIKIAAAGGGFLMDAAGRTDNDLIQIAAAAGRSGARLWIGNLKGRTTEDLIRISAAGKGAVFFAD